MGNPLGHSLSPRLHGLIYKYTGFDGAYNLLQVPEEQLHGVIPALRTLHFRGVNVTIPYKQKIIAYLDDLSPEAKYIGAVNTVLMKENGTACGYNTDYYGFLAQLEQSGIGVKGKRFLMCGMSGAGQAVHQALNDSGAAEIIVASTDPAKGIAYSALHQLPDMDVIVNCTPVGMHPKVDASVVDEAILSKFQAAVDVVYNPLETKLLRMAKAQGLRTSGGLYMLIYQGIRAFTIWTGIKPQHDLAQKIYKDMMVDFQ